MMEKQTKDLSGGWRMVCPLNLRDFFVLFFDLFLFFFFSFLFFLFPFI